MPDHNQASTSRVHAINRGRCSSPVPSSSDSSTESSSSEEYEEEREEKPFNLNLNDHDLAILYGEKEEEALTIVNVINIESNKSGPGGVEPEEEEEEPFEEVPEGVLINPQGMWADDWGMVTGSPGLIRR
ncbi:hypothetical protein QJS10_CPB04g01342 [Acorus calamus]|uniref:Uncharacterized protein n=1 Tax=Acorus calamus TaxID=4465 RepID=A0AAV9F020_ACOCL|nr:hypothetical protein QJS10_CPB04g01342 [Acorus calamus]